MQVPTIDKIIEFIKNCPFDKYSVSSHGIYKTENYTNILGIYVDTYNRKSEREIILNGVNVGEYYSEKDFNKIREALIETNKYYKQYLINNFIQEDLKPVLQTYNKEDFDGLV